VAGRPYVLLSAAISADGYLDDASGVRLVLSGAADLDRVDELRAGSDAILVGANTIRRDNPRLLVRSAARRERRVELGKPASPVKVTLTVSGAVDPQAEFFARACEPPLVYTVASGGPALARALADRARVIVAPPASPPAAAELDLTWVLADLASRGIGRLMVEGGSAVLARFVSAGLADELSLAVAPVFVADAAAPRLLAGPVPAGRMRLAGMDQVGDMAVLTYRLA
jgi:5-amino-6-(5-phosphoribosylamino)uracil reductase